MNRLILKQHQGRQTDYTKVVSVLSGKGGVGKSVIAFNLAERLAADGNRVLLVDADFQFGNIHILANTAGEYGLDEFLSGSLTLAESVTTVSERFDILPSGFNSTGRVQENISLLAQRIASLRETPPRYDIVLIDHASGVSDAATLIAHASDISLLVLVPELTSISDCYGLFKHLKVADQAIDCRLLVNRVEAESDAEYILNKFTALSDRFFGSVPGYMGCLPEAEIIGKGLASQLPVAALEPESVVVESISRLGRQLMGEPYSAAPATPSAPEIEYNENAAKADIKE